MILKHAVQAPVPGGAVGRLQVRRLTDEARLPEYGSPGAAGLDLCADLSKPSAETTTLILQDSEEVRVVLIEPGKRAVIATGIAVALPHATYGRIAPRSGLAVKSGIDVLAGVIDEDYRGEVGVVLQNLSDETVIIEHGMRIAQLIVEKYLPCAIEDVDTLSQTARGGGRFGSTGT